MADIPLLIVALTISAYWLRVGAMVVHARHHHRRRVGMIPERRGERLMWIVLVPLVVAWCALPWLALSRSHGWLAVPPFAFAPAYAALRWVFALVALACLVATIDCWRRMGPHWRMDISDDNTSLVTEGLFARIRHPIYAFSIAMMIATLFVLPTPPMLALAVVHVAIMNVKARSEEAHLARMHGEAYARYVARTGRFLPGPAARHL
ncbi:MAG TPA: isoprenylcysteine carboxylmethyltransferase family protein [Casimicrobiaceae bacterium]|nr:isoprenylcysteine carboxylmethyltransferase family protein [Casimicrobiaceae bacterium]